MKMPLSTAKQIFRQLKTLANSKPYKWEDLKAVYDQYNWKQYDNKYEFSPLYNQFTGKYNKWMVEKMKVGEKTGLYFDTEKKQVITWNGYRMGKVKNLSYYRSGGFAPCKRVSITFKYKNMLFRGICSYESMDCFTAKRMA